MSERIHQVVDRWAEDSARLALRFEGSSIRYAELAERSRILARALGEHGVGQGTRLGVLMANRPEWLATALAASRLDAVLFPLSTFLRERELADVLTRAEIGAVVYSPRFAGLAYEEILPDLRPRLPALRCLVRWPSFDAVPDPEASGPMAPPRPLAADAAIVFYTSGSTGDPKGVIHAHGSMARHARAIAARMGIGPDDRSWAAFPFFFSGGTMIFAYSGLAAGATLVLEEKFEPERALSLLQNERCTVYQAWPHQLEAMMALPQFLGTDVASVRKGNGAKFVPHDAFLRHPHEAIDGWGMSETLTYCCSTLWTDPLEERLASHGRPVDGVAIRIVDPESGEPVSGEGEMCVRGYNLMLGYLGEPAGSHLDRDGFFHSGDLGRIDAGGRVHFLGRLKEIIKTAGVNVSAAEVEKLLGAHPAVEAAYVVGVPDPSRGERIAAFVVRRGACSEEELADFVAARTARYKVPARIFFAARQELPETATGKVEKKRLREIAVSRIGKGPA